MSAPTTQTENEIIMAASVAQAEEEEMSAATAQAAVAQAVDNDRDHPVCTLSDDQKAMVEANMEFIKSKVGLQDVGILLFRR